MFKFNSNKVVIDGRTYNTDKTKYPFFPTAMSGVDIQWGAESCIENPDPSRAQMDLWIPKTHEGWLPELGDVVTISGIYDSSPTSTASITMFTGKIESVKLQDDHKPLAAGTTLYSNTAFPVTGSWVHRYATAGFSGPYTDITSSVTTIDGNTFNIPITPDGVNNWISTATPKINVVAGGAYAFTWTTNNGGALSVRTRYFDAAGAEMMNVITYGLNGRFDFTPPTGAVKVIIDFGAIINSNYKPSYTIGKFFFESFVPGTVKPSGYKVAIVAADALAEAARLRLSDAPWGFESVLNRQARIADLATNSGVRFNSGLTDNQGYSESLGTNVIPRDVDSASALEIFQRTCMASGHTVISADNIVQPSYVLKLPTNLSPAVSASPTNTTYAWTGTKYQSTSTMKINGVVSRTNYATNPTGQYDTTNYSYIAGTSGVADQYLTSGSWSYGSAVLTRWSNAAASGSTPSVNYKETTSGAINTKVSAGVMVKSGSTTWNYKDVKLSVILWNGATAVNTVTGPTVRIDANQWTYLKLENVNATSAYTAVEIRVLPQETTVAGLQVMVSGEFLTIDGVLIEKAATAGKYFDGNFVAKDATAAGVDRTDLAVFNVNQIEDDVFEIDTSKVVNELKVEMKLVTGSAGGYGLTDDDQVFTDQLGSQKTTPQTRSLSTDWGIQDTYAATDLPTSVMVSKGRLLLAAQSRPQWRLAEPIRPVLSVVDNYMKIGDLLKEDTRFGAIIVLNNGPDLLPRYFRVHAGRIVLGEDTHLEFEVEPVDYSAPIPLTRNTLDGDSTAGYTLIGNLKNLSSNDLRTIGAR